MQLQTENNFVRKEVQILKSEQDTVEEVSITQSQDIKRYLQKEILILEDVINKFNVRQKAENSRFNQQVAQVKQIS